MKRNKYGYLGLILACIAVVQYNYHLNEYVLLLLVVVSIAMHVQVFLIQDRKSVV